MKSAHRLILCVAVLSLFTACESAKQSTEQSTDQEGKASLRPESTPEVTGLASKQIARVKLPSAGGFPQRKASFPRYTFWMIDDQLIIPSDTTTDENGKQESDELIRQAQSFAKQHKIPTEKLVIEIRADRDVQAEQLTEQLFKLGEAGFQKIALAVQSEDQQLCDLWILPGNSTLIAPLPAKENEPSDELVLWMMLRLYADPNGEISAIQLNERRLRDIEELHASVLALVGNDASQAEKLEMDAEVDPDAHLRVEHIAAAVESISLFVDRQGKAHQLVRQVVFPLPRKPGATDELEELIIEPSEELDVPVEDPNVLK